MTTAPASGVPAGHPVTQTVTPQSSGVPPQLQHAGQNAPQPAPAVTEEDDDEVEPDEDELDDDPDEDDSSDIAQLVPSRYRHAPPR